MAGCGGAETNAEPLAPADASAPPRDAAQPPPPAPSDGGADAASNALTPSELLSTIDTVVVLMMENRSFDHYFGQLKQDAAYPARARVDGLNGNESNPASNGAKTPIFKLTDFTVADPPHGWDACHAQWNNGSNDGFVKAHAGPNEAEVMGYHDRSQIPFFYWLADNYTTCDHWFASVMGPTWPNRFYLHATTSKGKKDNSPFLFNAPKTLFEALQDKGKTFINYFDGPVSWYTGGFAGNIARLHPVARLDRFFADARNGTLPNFCVIDPDFTANDDHPDHDIMRGQALVATIYKALTDSPQWSRLLFIITYDEHGGFFDHVPPPKTTDPNAEFEQLGFRVPALVIGPTVKRGHLESTQYEHVTVAATLKARFGIDSLGPRMAATRDISACIDPAAYKAPRPPAANPPMVVMTQARALYGRMGSNSQEELDVMIANGQIPAALVDRRSPRERTAAWMREGESLGAVKLLR
jgi:phospholipase C